jgi:Flp pilus assembly protein TadD
MLSSYHMVCGRLLSVVLSCVVCVCQQAYGDPIEPVAMADTSEALADRLLAQGRYRVAVWAFEAVARRQPDSADLYRKLGAALAKDEQLPQAVVAY